MHHHQENGRIIWYNTDHEKEIEINLSYPIELKHESHCAEVISTGSTEAVGEFKTINRFDDVLSGRIVLL